MKQILKVNTCTGTIQEEECPGKFEYFGGRSFIANYLLSEINPSSDALGRENKFIISCGLLGDTRLTTAGRFSIGGKSPLTGGIKECNVGGDAGKKLARLGYKAVILEDLPKKREPKVLIIRQGECRLEVIPDLLNKEVSETSRILRDKYGKGIGIICIGPAGELGMASAVVATFNQEGTQLRVAARGGLGAVMGSKGIKAVVVDDAGAVPEKAFDPEALSLASKEVAKILLEDPKTDNRHNYGTAGVMALCNSLGILPTRNFSQGQFEKADSLSGELLAQVIDQRGGEGRRGLPCIKGCVIQCSNVFADSEGRAVVGSLQYETLALLGSNCGIGSLDEIARLNNLCNQVGVDTIETGAALGVAMESGLLSFGDARGAEELIRQIGRGDILGRVIGNGAIVTGQVLNNRRVPAIHGQAIPAYDPRSLKGIGVTYVTSPMGADHTAGNTLETVKNLPPRGREKQVETSYKLQIRAALLDSLGVCLFIRPAFVKNPELMPKLLNARYGWKLTYPEVQRMGKACLEAEKRFNHLAGRDETVCDVPEFMRFEPLPPHNTVFDISRNEMYEVWNSEIEENIF